MFCWVDFWFFIGVLFKINRRVFGVDFDGVFLIFFLGFFFGFFLNKIVLIDFFVGVIKFLDFVFWFGDFVINIVEDFWGVLENDIVFFLFFIIDFFCCGECLIILEWFFL